MKVKVINYIVAATITVAALFNFGIQSIYAVDEDKNKKVEVNAEIEIPYAYMNVMENIEESREILLEKRIEEMKKEAEERKKQDILNTLGVSSENAIEYKIYIACDKYNVPFKTVLAIARLETGWFTSDAYKYRNNPGGLSRNEVPLYFDTIDEGVDRFVSNLKKNYFDQGLTTPNEIGEKYCPVNPKWATMVSRLMNYPVDYKR